MDVVSTQSMASAKSAVQLAINLIGQMAMWLGFMAILEQAGVMRGLARLLRPVMVRLFPSVPPEHPAMSAMILNIGSNMLGLGNAATPFGLKAMIELDKLNDRPGVATDAMVVFLAINTSGVAVLPLGVVAVRAAEGAQNVSGIVLPSLIATSLSTIVGLIVAHLLSRLSVFDRTRYPISEKVDAPAEVSGLEAAESIVNRVQQSSAKFKFVALGIFVAYCVALGRFLLRPETSFWTNLQTVSQSWLIPLLMLIIVTIGLIQNVKIYEAFIDGAKRGFQVVVNIIPYLVAILVAVGMFRASGALDGFIYLVDPITSFFGFPSEALPMALIRPLSGTGAFAVMTETMRNYGPDSYVGFLVSVMNGSTETTFYVLALYFGVIGVKASRHALFACLAADITGAFAANLACRLFY